MARPRTLAEMGDRISLPGYPRPNRVRKKDVRWANGHVAFRTLGKSLS